MKKQKKRPEDYPRRTLHLDARVTPEEYEQVRQRAEECGMTRGDIVQFFNMFNSIEAEERQPLFKSAIFMRTWIEQLTKLALDLQNILDKRKE